MYTEERLLRFASPIFTDTGNHLQMVTRLWEVVDGISMGLL